MPGTIKFKYHYSKHEDIPEELHKEILYGNQVKKITDVPIEDINKMYEGLSLYHVVTSIKDYMEDLKWAMMVT